MRTHIQAQAEIIIARRIGEKRIEKKLQLGNAYSARSAYQLAYYRWLGGNANSANGWLWPWRLPAGLASSGNVNIGLFGLAGAYTHPRIMQFGAAAPALSTLDALRMRRSSAPMNILSTDPMGVIGSLLVAGPAANFGAWVEGLGVFSAIDVPVTMLGNVHLHPVGSGTFTTVAGQSYVTAPTYFNNGGFAPGALVIRITAGGDAGMYFVERWDNVNSRLYLRNLDGTPFVATTSVSTAYVAGYRAVSFNEVGVVASGTGVVANGGNYDDSTTRCSYVFTIHFDKSGSPTPADASQKGNYWFSIRPWVTGHRTFGNIGVDAVPFNALVYLTQLWTLTNLTSAAWSGGCPGIQFDSVAQRVWLPSNTGGSAGALAYWYYKTPEQLREVVSTATASPNAFIAGLTLGGNYGLIRDTGMGSDGSFYAACYAGAQGSFLRITRGLVATQFLATSIAGGADALGLQVDTTRARTGTAGDVSTTVGTGTVTSASGAFTNADIGRVIVLTGLVNPADNGTYKISAVGGATTVTVQTLAGGAVAFAGTTGGTFQIGDRIYLFFYNTTSAPAGTLVYMESLAWGTKLTVAMGGVPVNGAQIQAYGESGDTPPHTIDPSNGVLYWASMDVAQQVNRYDPATQTWSRRLLSDFNGANGGVGTIVNPTAITCLGVNPHAAFRELWIGTDAGWVMISPDAFAGATWSRYYGSGGDATPYSKPAGYVKSDGGNFINSRTMRKVRFGVDGSVMGLPRTVGDATSSADLSRYNREYDTWVSARQSVSVLGWGTVALTSTFFPPVSIPDFLPLPNGEIIYCWPQIQTRTTTSYNGWVEALCVGAYDVCYQWTGAAWAPKDVARGPIPDAISSPGCACKDLHTTLDDLVYGVKVKFTPQGGATPANNEFVGRMGTTGAARADGGTTLGSATFTGSGFVAADAGRLLRIHAGADAGVYRITVFTNANTVTLAKLNPGVAFSAAATAGALTYSIWDYTATSGPEHADWYAASGYAHDNTQDITGITLESFDARTLLSVQAEAVKAAAPYFGPPGSIGAKVYLERFPYATNPNYTAHTPQGNAFPVSAPITGGERVLANPFDKKFDSLLNSPDLGYVAANGTGNWGGKNPAGGTAGYHLTVDFGASVEVGSILALFGSPAATQGQYLARVDGYGSHFNVHNAPAGAAPAAASVVRTSGVTNGSITTGTTTFSVSTGDLLGTLTTSAIDGGTTIGGNRFTSAIGRFPAAYVGQVLKITTGLDVGSYRIIAVAADGSYCDITNLDQTAKTFIASAAGLSFEVRDAVREEDIISIGAGAHLLTVERLLTTTTLQTRCYPTGTLTGQSWSALKPTWALVKKIEKTVNWGPPEVTNNGTFVCMDGREQAARDDVKVYADFSDLATANRSGRYWKLSLSSYNTNIPIIGFAPYALIFFDPTGLPIGMIDANRVDTARTLLADFMACRISRTDFIHANDTAASHVAGSNGLASLAVSATGDTVTLAAAARFLGFQVRPPGASGSAVGGNSTFSCAAGDPLFTAADVGRILRVIAGVNAGYYRITAVPTTQSVTLATPGTGVAVTLAADAGPTAFAVHEGIATGDYIAFTTGGVSSTNRELTVLSISDTMQTVTTVESFTGALTNQNWEVRRRATLLDHAASGPATLTGNISQDSRGSVFPATVDIGPGTNTQHADGGTTIATGTFTGSGFTPDDVGRALVILTGADAGAYRISAYASAASITVVNLYTGAAVSFAATAGALSYYVQGERRFRHSRYATVRAT